MLVTDVLLVVRRHGLHPSLTFNHILYQISNVKTHMLRQKTTKNVTF